jgi:hypothetical protein
MLVREYKNAMKGKGPAYKNNSGKGLLSRWFKEKWVDIKTGKACGSVKTRRYYPTCRPSKRITSHTPKTLPEMSHSQVLMAIRQKQKVKGSNRIFY